MNIFHFFTCNFGNSCIVNKMLLLIIRNKKTLAINYFSRMQKYHIKHYGNNNCSFNRSKHFILWKQWRPYSPLPLTALLTCMFLVGIPRYVSVVSKLIVVYSPWCCLKGYALQLFATNIRCWCTYAFNFQLHVVLIVE